MNSTVRTQPPRPEADAAPTGFGIVSRPQHTPTAGTPAIPPAADVLSVTSARSCPHTGEHPAVSPPPPGREVGLGRLTVAVAELERSLDADDRWVDAQALEQLRDRLASLGAGVVEARLDGASRRRLVQLDQQVRELNTMLATHREAAREQQRAIMALQDRTQQLEDALVAAHRKNLLERDRSTQLERQLDLIEADLDEARATSDAAREELAATRRQVVVLKKVVGRMHEREQDALAALEEARAENDVLRAELSDTRSLLESTHEQLRDRDLELKRARVELREANERIDEAVAEAEIMEAWMNRALAHVAELQNTQGATAQADELELDIEVDEAAFA